jgi:DNA helicase-2/ATP-dependent DNA helicase PcrA
LSASPALLAAAPFALLLEGLTADQQTAVIHGHGPEVIFAGPGAGKTRTLTDRVRYLLASGRAIPREIVLVTFTNNAAHECHQRLERALGKDATRDMAIFTFYALCLRLLRTHAPLIARTASFTIYDERSLHGVIEEILKDKTRTDVQEALQRRAPSPTEEVSEEISLAKNRLWTPEVYARHSRQEAARLAAAVWAELDEELSQSNACGFDDLLCLAVRLLGEHPDLQQHYRARAGDRAPLRGRARGLAANRQTRQRHARTQGGDRPLRAREQRIRETARALARSRATRTRTRPSRPSRPSRSPPSRCPCRS